ncbi:hypothetical protein [Burkholderia pseudomallei]|uniref:hypothetical protein n=1 Tax=Burkholderia pseudomallei TaxID=28450 RepID=UPI001A0AE428|nr:hypothetical protein [Burkholderia pseudomallei]MBF3831149.1 hypothetical protein [Burkholderia pseudomallei]
MTFDAFDLALDQTISFSDTDDYATTTPSVAAVAHRPVFRVHNRPSQHVRFLDQVVRQYRVLPDLATLRVHAGQWLANDEPSLTGAAFEAKTKTLAAYGHSFGRTYHGFTTHDEAPS